MSFRKWFLWMLGLYALMGVCIAFLAVFFALVWPGASETTRRWMNIGGIGAALLIWFRLIDVARDKGGFRD